MIKFKYNKLEELKMEEKDLKKEEVKQEERLIGEEPKTITFEIGINGIPKLNIYSEKEVSIRDIATALATIDLLNFNNYLKSDKESAIKNYVLFETLRKEIFINGIAQLTGGDSEIIDSLSELI